MHRRGPTLYAGRQDVLLLMKQESGLVLNYNDWLLQDEKEERKAKPKWM